MSAHTCMSCGVDAAPGEPCRRCPEGLLASAAAAIKELRQKLKRRDATIADLRRQLDEFGARSETVVIERDRLLMRVVELETRLDPEQEPYGWAASIRRVAGAVLEELRTKRNGR